MNACRYSRRIAFAAIVLAASVARAENWPSFRGPQGTGVSGETGVPLKWGDKENMRWRAPLPDRGNSTPVVWGDRVFVTQAVEQENRRALIAFDRRNGRLLWQSGTTFDEREPTNSQNPYCSASPATDGKHVVAKSPAVGSEAGQQITAARVHDGVRVCQG